MEPWQVFILTTVFGWVDDKGRRRFKTAYIEVPRKNGKSSISSLVALYCLAADGEKGAEVYSAATTRDQARIVWQDAKHMAKNSPGLKSKFGVDITAHSIHVTETASYFKALSRDQGGNLDGLNVHCAIIDELHAHKTRDIFDVIETATGAREQPLLWLITTAGFNRAGICYEQRAYSLKILAGLEDKEYFGIVYTLDDAIKTHLDPLDGIKKLEELCDCRSVPTTLIENHYLKACAKHAITGNGQRIDLGHTTASIHQDLLSRLGFAVVATTEPSSKKIQSTRLDKLQTEGDGQERIKRKSRKLLSAGDREISKQSLIGKGLRNTGLQQKNTASSTALSQEVVPSAKSANELCALITATNQALSEACSVPSATLQSVCLETLRRAYSEHSPTCSALSYLSLQAEGLILNLPADDWQDPKSWAKANPNWGVSVKPEDIERKARKAMEMAAAQNNFLTKHCNLWVNADTAWMDMRAWERCGDPALDISDFEGLPCFGGLDLATKTDIASRVFVFERDGILHAFDRHYLPEETVENNANSQYSGWEIDGYLTATPGNITDYDVIEDDILIDAKRFRVEEFGYDPFQATQMSGHLVANGLPMVQVGQTVKNLSEPMKELEALVIAGKFKHNGNPVLSWMISNVVAHVDAKDNIYPRKEFPQNKIDGVVALLIAINRWSAQEDTGHAYQDRGFITL